MKTQFEKNKELLMEEIEKYSEQPMTNAIAERLSAYHGALKAMCMAGKGWEDEAAATDNAARTADKPARTPELDGDTEFERVVMEIPIDPAHVTAVFNIFADHMEQLAIVNHRAYENIMLKLREVARN